ncbi:MAG: purine-binding chemotaxis protein CheW [Holophagales bacterium]|jgi:purine-binding chemotaxis protein CheW|nr:purine-binding chemotaxis protein CheW [Holophagales bacterium]MBK9963684.1 purine-binding chemotaxis protein CheW [Holophagales bacterium]
MGADPEVPGGSPPASLTADGAVDLLAFADWVSAGQKGRATREAVEEKTYVAFLIDREEFGLPVESVREILRVGEVTRVPQAPPHIRGVTNVRGSILPVVEIRTRIGLPPLDPGPRARIVVLELGERALGLLVDRVTRVAKVRVTEIEPPPAEIVTTRTDYVVGVAKGPEGLLILLDPARTLVVRA